jgi:hypothetical protein
VKNQAYFEWMFVATKFAGAVETLTTSFARNSERMEDAISQISFLKQDHFPDPAIFKRYEKIMAEATKFGPVVVNGEAWIGSIRNTLSRRKRPTFERMAEEILSIYHEILTRRGTYQEEQ